MATTSSIEIANTPVGSNTEAPVIPFVFDASYKGDELTRRVADILHLPDINGWSVIDSDEDVHLAMVHYADNADMSIYGHLRGLLVDTEVGAVIADSFGYTPTAITSELQESNGSISIRDKSNSNHVFSLDDVVIKRVFEGVVIRVIWHKGKCYRMTHRKINPLRSRWGSSKTFISMYEEAGGPTPDQLFDTTKPYSNTCYDFLVVDPSLLVGTRQKVTRPYIVCLAQRTMDVKRPVEEVAPGHVSFTTTDIIGGAVTESMIHDPKQLSLQEANHHLKFGYYNSFENDDNRQLTGEAVIMYRMTNGVVSDIVKVHSPAYEWRLSLRGNNPNITNQFYLLLNSVYNDINTPETWDALRNKLILLPLYDEQSLRDLYTHTQGILTIPSGDITQEDYRQRDSRIHLLWMNYVLSLPSPSQHEALNILTNFRNDRNDVITWIQSLESTIKDIETADVPDRVKGLISSARRLARDRISNGSNYSARGSYMKLPLLIKSTLRNLINKENGSSLYGLVREMKESRKVTPVQAVPVQAVQQ
jgi:hypothetical protein